MSDKLQKFKSGATRTPSRLRYDLIPPAAMRALAERFGIGAVIHGDTNWRKGIPFSACIYHMEEHLQRFKEGRKETRTVTPKTGGEPFEYTDGDVENLAAIMWGCAAMIQYIREGRPELDDRVYRPTFKHHPNAIVETDPETLRDYVTEELERGIGKPDWTIDVAGTRLGRED